MEGKKMSIIMKADMSPFFLRVDHVAADITPEHAVKHLCRLSDRIGIAVYCEINGVDVSVFPDTNEDIMAERYTRALEKKAKWISSNSSPVTVGL